MKNINGQFDSRFGLNMSSHFRSQINYQLNIKPGSQLDLKLWRQFRKKLWSQTWLQLADHIHSQLQNDLL